MIVFEKKSHLSAIASQVRFNRSYFHVKLWESEALRFWCWTGRMRCPCLHCIMWILWYCSLLPTGEKVATWKAQTHNPHLIWLWSIIHIKNNFKMADCDVAIRLHHDPVKLFQLWVNVSNDPCCIALHCLCVWQSSWLCNLLSPD